MPSHSGQFEGIATSDFSELFRGGDNFDQPSVIEHQSIAILQNHSIGKIEHELYPAHACHGDAAAIAAFIIQNNGIGRFDLPSAFGTDETGFDHGSSTPRD